MSRPEFVRAISLDFDGVLHPAGGPPGQALPFCWLCELEEILTQFPDVGIAVHSSWSERFSLDDMREFLGSLGPRLLGAVGAGAKADSVLAFAQAHPEIGQWLVIDDQVGEFTSTFALPVLICEPGTGLSDPETKRQLFEWLKNHVSPDRQSR